MEYRTKIGKIDAFIKWQFKKGLKDIVEVNIREIPLKWEKFPNSNDLWKRLPDLEAATGRTCLLYKPELGSIFPPHIHPTADETVFCREGSMDIFTPYYFVKVKKNESFTIKKNTPHIVEFDEKVQSLVEVNYEPAFEEGWKGKFF